MRFRVTLEGRWRGPLLHAFDDLTPRWDAARRGTVVVVDDQTALVTVVNRASEYGVAIVGVETIEDQ